MRNTLQTNGLIVILLLVLTIDVFGQALPETQTKSLWTPKNLKIDGKAEEWSEKFQSYNHNTDIYYTISNDDHDLYLIIRAIEPSIIYKIITGGIMLTINHTEKNLYAAGNISVTYPFFENMRPGIDLKNKPKVTTESALSVMKADSFASANNERFEEKAKLIEVKGINTLDTLISIYNVEGIKAAARFNKDMYYTYEISIALKYISAVPNKALTFFYNLRLNGISTIPRPVEGFTAGGSVTMVISKRTLSTMGQNNALFTPTDFWGYYILAQPNDKN